MSLTQPTHEPLIDPTEIQNRLSAILVSLQQESDDARKHYHLKIAELGRQIQRRDSMLSEMQHNMDTVIKKCQQLQWKILEKDNKIEDLQSKIKNMQSIYKDKINHFLQKLDLSESVGGKGQQQQSETSKRINISEYFIKSIENSKPSTNIINSASADRKDNTKEDIISTKIDNEDVSISSEPKYSLALRCLKTESDPAGRVYQRAKDRLPRRASGKSNVEGKENKEQRGQDKHDGQQFIISASHHNSKKKIEDMNAHSKRQIQGEQKGKGRSAAIEYRRAELMEQRWKQISAFEQRINKTNNTVTR